MEQTIPIIQLGCGGVGRALIQQVQAQSAFLASRYGFTLAYLALVDRSGALVRGQMLSRDTLTAALAAKQTGRPLATVEGSSALEDWRAILPSTPAIVVDVTAAEGMESALSQAAAAGHRVVLANKRPLTAALPAFTALTDHGATRYEATVGAGLPVINTLQGLLDSGDTLVRVEASMSGTLGYLASALEEGEPLATAVQTAHTRGWTEPDPRDDLSGADVARKALILARTAGLAWDMAHVPAEPWFPAAFTELSVEHFMQRLPELNDQYAERVARARSHDMVLRYVATIESDTASVELRELPRTHPLAALRGTDNLFSFTTARYAAQPLVVRGPGAGIEVTAAGVLADVVATAREML